MPQERQEAAPPELARKLLTWLNARGYELPGDPQDWRILKPDMWGRRRSQYEVEQGMQAWYLSYVGEDEEAKNWSDSFGGVLPPARVINNLHMVEMEEVWDRTDKYRSFACMQLTFSEEMLKALPPKMRTTYVYQCDTCNYRTEDNRKDFAERFVHSKCGQGSRYVLVDTIKVEVPREI